MNRRSELARRHLWGVPFARSSSSFNGRPARPAAAWRGPAACGAGGQSIIESVITVALISVIFFGIVQMALLFTAKEVVTYAANKGARARTVGFNNFMIFKTVRVGTIANAGKMRVPNEPGGLIQQSDIELASIPFYLGAPDYGYLGGILDYEDWPTVSHSSPTPPPGGTLRVRVNQDYPLRMPLHRVFYADDNIRLRGESRLDNHYGLYLNDMGW
jgi:hypothetical protein